MNFFKKHKYTIILGCIGILISPFLYLLYNKTIKLTPFEITSFEQNVKKMESFRTLSWTKSRFAEKYEIVVLDDNNKVIEVIETKDTKVKLDNINVNNGENIIINVNAVDKFENKKSANIEEYKIEWEIPSLDIKDEDNFSNQENLILDILNNNNYDLNDYDFVLYKEDTVIYKDKINNGQVFIPIDITKTLLGKYRLELKNIKDENDCVIDSKNIEFIVPEINDIKIIYPENNSTIPWDDFDIKFIGGDNAINYYINLIDITNNSKILNNIKQSEKTRKVIISTLKENRSYKLQIIADNPIDSSVNIIKESTFKTSNKLGVKKVESDTPNGSVVWNKKITLKSLTDDTTIYYTIDGSIPTFNSKKYTDPIKINSKMTIKAIAIKRNMIDSEISEFRYNPINNGLGSSSSKAPISLYNEGFLPVRYYNQRTSYFGREIYGPKNNDWNDGEVATISSHGCGPVALSIVVSTLTEKDITPKTVTDYACKNGYCTQSGTLNSIITDYSKKQGLKVELINKKDKDRVINSLKSKESLIIAVMGPKTFTSTAHFIVLRGITDDEKVLVADPNSFEKSQKLWDLDLIIKESKEKEFYIISK